MRTTLLVSALILFGIYVSVGHNFSKVAGFPLTKVRSARTPAELRPQTNTLCTRDERVIFSRLIRKPAKIVSVSGSGEQ